PQVQICPNFGLIGSTSTLYLAAFYHMCPLDLVAQKMWVITKTFALRKPYAKWLRQCGAFIDA
ncbi:MAG TPA: hypothetical protein VGD99_23680, partial [Anaerolineae bacterium]